MLMESGFLVGECGWVRVTQGDTGRVSKGNKPTHRLRGEGRVHPQTHCRGRRCAGYVECKVQQIDLNVDVYSLFFTH